MVREGQGFGMQDMKGSEEASQIIRRQGVVGAAHPTGSGREPGSEEG